MAGTTSRATFRAKLERPAAPKHASWAFLLLPKAASAKLPSRSMVTVHGKLGDATFTATLEPDGEGSHWLKVGKALLDKAGVKPGDRVQLDIAPVEKEPEPRVPADFRRALSAASATAKTTWKDTTPLARRDWIHWITSGKKAETRVKRIDVAIDKLAKGNRRACCFDRSGMASRGNMGPPEAAE